MKKYSKIIAGIAMIVAVVGLIVACGMVAGCKPAEAQYVVDAYEKPSGLAEGQLDFEWKVRRTGNPSAIVFNDVRSAYSVDGLTFPQGLRSVEYSSSNYVPIKDNLWEYWGDNGHNIAVFHTESFSVGTPSDYYSKIRNEGGAFVNSNGSAQSETLSVSLTRAFATAYVKEFDGEVAKYNKGANDDDLEIPDVRFVGSGVGALYAVFAADYIYGAYTQGHISEYLLPDRLAIINPWFADETVLSDVADAVERLARFGVVIEYIESDSEADSLFTDAQTAAHNRIIAQSAYLKMSESYSGGLTPETKEQIGMAWYLASVNGSDYYYLSSSKPETDKYRNPVYNVPDSYYNTYNNYAVSAWTPTPYLRLLRGVSFTQKTYKNNSFTDYTSDKFRIELYQCSDKTGLRVGGYAFADANADNILNDGRITGVLRNVKVELIYKDGSSSSSEETVVGTTVTDERGFYLFEVETDTYYVRNRTFYVRFYRPNYRYSYTKNSGTLTEDVAMRYSTADGNLTTIGSYYTSEINRTNRTNRLVNCGFKPSDKEGDK